MPRSTGVGRAGGLGLALGVCFLLLSLCTLPAQADPPALCIGSGQEHEIQNMMIPFRLGLPIIDGYVLDRIVVESERVVVRLTRDASETRLLLLPPEKSARKKGANFTIKRDGDPAGFAAADALAARVAVSNFDPWARCSRRTYASPEWRAEMEQNRRQPDFGILLVLLSSAALTLALSAYWHRRGRHLRGHTALTLSATLFGLLLAEALLRVTLPLWTGPFLLQDGCYNSNPRGYFTPIEVLDMPGTVIYCTGGMAQTREECATPAREFHPDAYRILTLGDSFTEAKGVYYADSWPRLLEIFLKRNAPEHPVRVVNCGRSGANLPDITRRYEEVEHGHDPQLVVYGWVLNDVPVPAGWGSRDFTSEINFQTDHKGQIGRYILEHPWASRVSGQSAIGRLLVERLTTRRIAADTADNYKARYADPISPELSEALDATAHMAADCRAKGRRFLVMIWPLIYRLDAYPFREAHEVLRRELVRRGVPVVDLLPVMAAHKAKDLWVHPTDYHPNEIAHALAAEALGKALIQLGWLERLPRPEAPEKQDE